MYLIMLTNTALADYALGYFDESLRLYDRALGFTQKVQSARDEAYCLYGIGVNYYAHAIGSAPGNSLSARTRFARWPWMAVGLSSGFRSRPPQK
jgi:tetratricopeptide (TPR) repeat protein